MCANYRRRLQCPIQFPKTVTLPLQMDGNVVLWVGIHFCHSEMCLTNPVSPTAQPTSATTQTQSFVTLRINIKFWKRFRLRKISRPSDCSHTDLGIMSRIVVTMPFPIVWWTATQWIQNRFRVAEVFKTFKLFRMIEFNKFLKVDPSTMMIFVTVLQAVAFLIIRLVTLGVSIIQWNCAIPFSMTNVYDIAKSLQELPLVLKYTLRPVIHRFLYSE